MPQQEEQQQVQKVDQNVTNISPIPKELAPEFQKYISDADPLEILFYKAFCGWRKTTEVNNNTILGIKIKSTNEIFIIDENARMINETGIDYAHSSISALINHLSSTSNLTDMQIYNEWNGKFYEICFKLLDSYSLLGNPYNIKNISDIPTITSFVLSFNNISSKSKGGFFLKEISESFLSTTMSRYGELPVKHDQSGVFSKIGSALFKR